MEELIRKSDMLETYAELYDIFDDNKEIQKEISKVYDKLNDIPAVETWELYNPDEWCRDCKEYDTEKHNCPRWNRVIHKTLEENQPKQGEWIEMGENEDGTHNIKCSYCNMCTKSKGHANSYYTKHIMRYCNSCGARMKGAEDETD